MKFIVVGLSDLNFDPLDTSHSPNILGKGMNPTILHTVMDK